MKLVLIGSCRNQEDEQRVKDLDSLSRQLGIEQHVAFELNISFERLQEKLNVSAVGLHSMKDEHFGIGNFEHLFIMENTGYLNGLFFDFPT